MLSRTVPQVLALTLLVAASASAAEVEFRSAAPLRETGRAGEEAALQDALGRLLVRVTGRRAAASLAGRFPPAMSIVRHYKVIDGRRLEAEFDENALRQALEQAGERVWEGERPRLALWLVMNDGERWLFRPARAFEAPPPPAVADIRMALNGALGRAFAEASALRGIGIDFAPAGAGPGVRNCVEQLWTGFAGCLPQGAGELLMLGRVAVPGSLDHIEWSLREKGLWREPWESSAAEAVHRATDVLAARFMATQGPVRSYLLLVAPVPDLAAYADLQSRLDALQAVRDWRVDGAARDSLTLRITSATAEAPLRDALGSLGLPFELATSGP